VNGRAGLEIGGIPARELARRFGTPLFVYDAGEARARFRALKGAFRVREPLICYALKANPCRALASVLAREGAGADIVSGGELARARRAGFDPRRVVFSGVGKTEVEMKAGLRAGLLAFNVESSEELDLLARTAGRLGRRAPVAVRLNPDVDPRTHPHITTGRAENKFGVEAAEALALYRRAAKDRRLRVVGLQCHIGSQITELAPYRRAAASVARTMKRLQGLGIRLAHVDVGGGIGITYKDERPLALDAFARTLEEAFAPWPDARLLLEPGRFLVADAGVLLTRALYRKKTTKRRFVVVDAAMTDLPRPALYDAWHPVEPVAPRAGRSEKVDVVGPVCESGDFLARERVLAPIKPGDLLAVGKAGAYGFAMSSQYNSRPRSAEVVVDKGRAFLARRRETLKDLWTGER
jgi:diaminopimelate decarboxylase